MIIGTAGYVDHNNTELIKALIGKVCLILLIVFFIGTGWADKVYLKDGRVIEGSIGHTTEKHIDITTANGLLMSLEITNIDSIEVSGIGSINMKEANDEGKISNVTPIPFSRKTRPNTIFGGVGIIDLITIGYKRQVFPYFSIGIKAVGIFLVNGGGIGFKYYCHPTSSHSFTVGIYQEILYCIYPFNPWTYLLKVTSITIGYDYSRMNGFNFFFDIGGSLIFVDIEDAEHVGWGFFHCINIGVGYSY